MRVRSYFFDIKPGGGGLSRKPEDQTDTVLLAPCLRTRAIVKYVLHERTFFSFLKCFIAGPNLTLPL
jgi:hypothetical protein